MSKTEKPQEAPEKPFKSVLDAILYIEEDAEDPNLYVAAYQLLIDTGHVWHLQGLYQRTAARLIESGVCHQ